MDQKTKEEIIKQYLNGKTAKELSQVFPYHNATISKMLRQEGISRGRISKKRLDISEQVKKDFIEQNLYCEDIAKKYQVDVHTIYRILDDAGIERKTGYHSKCNEHYFEKIETPNQAYLLGFITADGAVVNQILSIEVQEEDIAILNFAKKEINPYAALTASRGCLRVCFGAKQIGKDLEKYGIVQNKSKIIEKVPIALIPDHLLHFYFRGLIDGDGSISNEGRLTIYSGSEKFIKDVQQILVEKAGVKQLKIYKGTTYFVSWSSKEDKEKLFNYIYKNLEDTFYYQRKYQRLQKVIQANTEVTE